MEDTSKCHRVTVRLNEKQYAFIKDNADAAGVSPSDFLRMLINGSLVGIERLKRERLVINHENQHAD